ncbi:MAG: tRNA (adenosine(37)-N6)-dimethylallyltransferase MiaA [Rhodomicrobium sp.]|nr:tRNA (adenosine(37)-N6)-dimethylallyltransferase MiaA [Rhodomicrobium sp.]
MTNNRDGGGARYAVLIAGPTASGKSALALELAKEFGGVIINADSMQVYAGLRVITNRPSPEEEATVPHRLYGFRPVQEPYSAALWLADVRASLAEAERQGWLPIIVGGTGLYFKALTEGLSDIPDIPAEIRTHYRLAAQTGPTEALYSELLRRDPLTAARLRPSDPQRIVRALEVLEATGRPLAEWQGEKQPPLLPLSETYPLAVTLNRDELYHRCEARFDAMIAHGAIGEARAIAALGLDPALPAMRAVGLPPLLAYLRGEISLNEASTEAKTNTRNYAKRQLTWIRSNFNSWNELNAQSLQRIKHEIDGFLRNLLTSAY